MTRCSNWYCSIEAWTYKIDIEQIARKLHPLMPEQVRHWLRVRDTANTELRTKIDRQIVRTAYERLGSFNDKPLLSLPPERKAKGKFHFGKIVYDKERWDLGLSSSELLQNIAVFGRSGAGKTNVVFHLLQQLMSASVPFLFLDWKRTARHLLPYSSSKMAVYTVGRSLAPFPFNPFIPPPGLEPHIYLAHVIDAMASAYTLGDGARSLLQKAVLSLYETGIYAPSVQQIAEKTMEIPAKGRVHGWQTTAMRALDSIGIAKTVAGSSDEQQQLANSILKGNTVIELDALPQAAKKFLIPVVCLWLYYVQMNSPDREKLKYVIVVEEAHHVLYRQENRTKESVMNMLLRQCREIGIGMLVVDQHPHLVSAAAMGNTYTSVFLNQKDTVDINKVAGVALLDESQKKFLSMLPVGQGVVKLQDRWHRPLLVNFPHVNIKKGAVTDELLERFMAGNLTFSALRASVGANSLDFRRSRLPDRGLSDDAIAFIEDVYVKRNDGVDVRYKRLGFSADKGNRLKRQLIEQGIVEASEVRIGRTIRTLLRLTNDARKKLDIRNSGIKKESIQHEFWKRSIAEQLQEKGYAVELESPRKNGNVDIHARKRGESVAIEIETGKSNVLANVKNCLLSGFQRIVIVATDEDARRVVERLLAKEGLLLPSRIIIAVGSDAFQFFH